MSIDKRYYQIAVSHRRAIHKRPEPGWCEFETTYRIASTLRNLGFEVKAGIEAIDVEAVMGRDPVQVQQAIERAKANGVPQSFIESLGGYTGAVACLDTGKPGPVTALRFDIDCVMVEESKEPTHEAVVGGYRSEITGCMHACGHDAHTAVGLTTAQWVAEHQDELTGRFVFLFQPAEEGARGSHSFAAKGWVDNVDYFFCSHIGGDCKVGQATVFEEGFLATTKIDINFTGRPSHAGADPEKGRSALLAAAAASILMQGIPRHSAGASRISIGTLHAGEGRNVTPVHAALQIETRGATHEINEYMVENVERIAKGIEITHEVKVETKKVGAGTTLKTTAKGTAIIREVCQSVAADNFIECPPPGASEDCTILMRRAIDHGAECGYFQFGCNHHGHHKADFCVQDEESLPLGVELYVALCKKLNG